MRWIIGGTILLALTLGAGCLSPGDGVGLSDSLSSDLLAAPAAPSSFTLDGERCVAESFTFAGDIDRVGGYVLPPFELAVATGTTPVLALFMQCDQTTLEGVDVKIATFGGLFAIVTSENADADALNLYALQAFTGDETVHGRLATLQAPIELVTRASRGVHPEIPNVGGYLRIDVPFQDGGFDIEGYEIASRETPTFQTWHVWAPTPAGFVRVAIDVSGVAAGGGNGQLEPATGSLVNELRLRLWPDAGEDKVPPEEPIDGQFVRLDFTQRGRVDLMSA